MKPRPEVKTAQLAEFISSAQSMPGKITGLRSLKAGTPQLPTASRSQGFGMAVVAVLEQLEDLEMYTNHPIHVEYVYHVRSFYRRKACAHRTPFDGGFWAGHLAGLTYHYRLHEKFGTLFDDMLAYDMEFWE